MERKTLERDSLPNPELASALLSEATLGVLRRGGALILRRSMALVDAENASAVAIKELLRDASSQIVSLEREALLSHFRKLLERHAATTVDETPNDSAEVERVESVKAVLSGLTRAERDQLHLYYVCRKPETEILQHSNVSIERFRAICKRTRAAFELATDNRERVA